MPMCCLGYDMYNRVYGDMLCMTRCMAGFVYEHDRCMVKDVWCHVVVGCLVSVCVCELDASIECAFNRVKTLDTMMGSQP